MSQTSSTTSGHTRDHDHDRDRGRQPRRLTTETKASVKTSEMIAYVAAVIGVLVASALVDSEDFGSYDAWRLVTYLTIGYMIARGLAKAGSHQPYDE